MRCSTKFCRGKARPHQRYCRRCHAAKAKEYRFRQKLAALTRELAKVPIEKLICFP